MQGFVMFNTKHIEYALLKQNFIKRRKLSKEKDKDLKKNISFEENLERTEKTRNQGIYWTVFLK